MTIHIIHNNRIVGTAKGDSQDDLTRWATAAAKRSGLKHYNFKFIRGENEGKIGKLTKEIRW
jgi:hypothetical protein